MLEDRLTYNFYHISMDCPQLLGTCAFNTLRMQQGRKAIVDMIHGYIHLLHINLRLHQHVENFNLKLSAVWKLM